MLAFFRNLFGRPAQAASPIPAVGPSETPQQAARRPNPQRISARRSLARMNAKNLALGKDGEKYALFEARSGRGLHRLLGCGPTLNVDGTPMVGDTGVDVRGKPYGVTEEIG